MTSDPSETDLFRDVLAALQVVVSIGEDLWFHDGHQSILVEQTREATQLAERSIAVAAPAVERHLLADASVSGQHVGVLGNGES